LEAASSSMKYLLS